MTDPSPDKRLRFAPRDLVEAQRPFVEEFWADVLGGDYRQSFISNDSQLSSWEHYVGDRNALVARVLERYGVDIGAMYDSAIPDVIDYVRTRTTRSTNSRTEVSLVRRSGFEADGGFGALLRRLRIFDDYTAVLPRRLSAILREQFAETIVESIRLVEAPEHAIEGAATDADGRPTVQRISATLHLELVVTVEDSRYRLDTEFVMRISDADADPVADYDFDVLGQERLA